MIRKVPAVLSLDYIPILGISMPFIAISTYADRRSEAPIAANATKNGILVVSYVNFGRHGAFPNLTFPASTRDPEM